MAGISNSSRRASFRKLNPTEPDAADETAGETYESYCSGLVFGAAFPVTTGRFVASLSRSRRIIAIANP